MSQVHYTQLHYEQFRLAGLGWCGYESLKNF